MQGGRPLRGSRVNVDVPRDVNTTTLINRAVRQMQLVFKDGLSTLGVLSSMQQYPDIMEQLFVHQGAKVDAGAVEALFVPQHAEIGSNRYQRELVILGYWRDLLLDLDDQELLPTLMQFVTGMDCIPTLGFHPQPMLTFRHDTDADDFT